MQKLTEAISSIKMLKLIDKDEFFIQNVFKEMARKQNNEIIFRVVGKLPRLIFIGNHCCIHFIIFCI